MARLGDWLRCRTDKFMYWHRSRHGSLILIYSPLTWFAGAKTELPAGSDSAQSAPNECKRPPALVIENDSQVEEQAKDEADDALADLLLQTDALRQPQSKLELIDRDALIEQLLRQTVPHDSVRTVRRDDSEAALSPALGAASNGSGRASCVRRPSVLLLYGPSGVGKSSAAAALARRLMEGSLRSPARSIQLIQATCLQARERGCLSRGERRRGDGGSGPPYPTICSPTHLSSRCRTLPWPCALPCKCPCLP